jgi:tRNA uridine 5-carboxymethylaminomethyl modification enzyme
VQGILATQPEIVSIQGEVCSLVRLENGTISGLGFKDGREISARAVILCTGTFLGGVLYTGLESESGGRIGENSSHDLALELGKMFLPTGRLKTGTPPRLNANTVDFSVLEEQPGDPEPVPFSFLNDSIFKEQVSCWVTRTNPETHSIVQKNLSSSPMYAGRIEGKGPRYCPSLEDKIVRFANRAQHTVFLEPEGKGSELLYANGISTSLPLDVQEKFVRTIAGLEKAQIHQPGYAVEYSFVSPRVLKRTLEVRNIPGLYLAGQICGTSGYEEAAAQGLMAGFNAALKLTGREPFVLGRHEAYIGVLIDDLVVSDPQEPYRMFTSRAEHRLLLRHDTADRRLTAHADRLGAVSAERIQRLESRSARLKRAMKWLQETPIPKGKPEKETNSARCLRDLLRQTDAGIPAVQELVSLPSEFGLSQEEWKILEADILYEGYVKRQQEWVEGSQAREQAAIPEEFDFQEVRGLRNEAKECLTHFRPATLGAAGRLAGISPADVALMEVALRRESHQ